MKDFISNKIFFLILYLDMFFMSTEEFNKKYPIVEEDYEEDSMEFIPF